MLFDGFELVCVCHLFEAHPERLFIYFFFEGGGGMEGSSSYGSKQNMRVENANLRGFFRDGHLTW